ncbi:MAG: lycopene cyclase domain-containing protein [Candidatus Micrarchaeota archaeon]|nr:lycopene cyclase domain-containing protein [Candidatus Micrarchaeota archaeon]
MGWFYYLGYLALVLFSSLLMASALKMRISLRRFAEAVLPVFAIFVLWDIAAVERGHWSFGLDKMSGIIILNQPIEELAFFLVIPFFYVVVWEAAKKAASGKGG